MTNLVIVEKLMINESVRTLTKILSSKKDYHVKVEKMKKELGGLIYRIGSIEVELRISPTRLSGLENRLKEIVATIKHDEIISPEQIYAKMMLAFSEE